jgi:putative ABC transport system substrate-binding protein
MAILFRRRQFLLFCGTTAAMGFRVHAKQSEVLRAIGILAQELQPGLLEAFTDELQKIGYVKGANIKIEVRDASGQNNRLSVLAQELLTSKVEVIVAINTPAAQAAKKITQTIPVVMMRVADPVKSGLVTSLARPGGNVTGLSFMPDALGPKGVELLHQILPEVTRMAALYRGDNPGAVVIVDEVIQKAGPLGLKFERAPVQGGAHDIAAAFDVVDRAKSEALFVMDDGAITANRQEILRLATARRIPVVSIYRDFAKSGGLIAYGPKLDIVYRRAAHFVDKVLKGESVGDLPVEQPAIFDVVVNLRPPERLVLPFQKGYSSVPTRRSNNCADFCFGLGRYAVHQR